MTKTGGRGELRIIGGDWRGRKLRFPATEGLRPTSDRIRETLFNWLTPAVHGARCLDLFAGSGALGLEALSRGAASCDFVDRAGRASDQITAHLQTLGATARGRSHRMAAEAFLESAVGPYDLVFIDPPFDLQLQAQTCAALEHFNLLAATALIYVESPASDEALLSPPGWELHRDKTSGAVAYRLYRRSRV